MSLFLKGIIIGFSIAAPVGPIGVLCIRRTLADGRAAGLVSGLGAATADAVYGAIAGFGLTFVSGLLIGHQAWLRLAGGVFLVYLGVRTFSATSASEGPSRTGAGLLRAYASTFLLTLTNPMTILSFAAIFAGLGLANAAGGYTTAGGYGVAGSYTTAGALVAGVFLGSAAWWLILSGSAGAVRSKVGPPGMRWINRLSGCIIAAFGLAAFISLIR
ncbi:MAG: LysE family transporter [bacterium]|nr:LysE family transporter [bacterium]